MKNVILGIGIAGSGKTTVLKNFAEKYGYAYICPDNIRQEMTGNAADQSRNREVWAEAYQRTRERLHEGATVVLDATFANSRERKDFIAFVREQGAEKVEGIFLDVPFEVAKERNQMRERKVPDYAMKDMERNLRDSLPEINDGFDALFTLNHEQQLVEVKMRNNGEENNIIHKEFGKPL